MTTSPREAELLAVIAARDEEIERLRKELALVNQKVDLLVRRIFGASSEKLDSAQLLLLLQGRQEDLPGKTCDPGVEAADLGRSEKAPKSLRKERTPRLPEHLPVIEQVEEPQVVKAHPEAWRRIGEEVSEQLDYEPARFIRRRLIRPKYVRRGDADSVPIIAPLPAKLQERCIAAPGLLAQIVVGKYCDHLPLYRQEAIYLSRHGVYLPRQSMARWMGLAAEWLKPIYEQIRTGVMGGGYVQVDETPIEYLEPGNGQTRLGYLWTYNRPGRDVVFDWQTSRAATCLDNVIPVDFQGTLQCDGYAAYGAFAKSRSGAIMLAGCWAHVRRKFHEAMEQSPRTAGWIIKQIAHLYRMEESLRERNAGPNLRAAERAWKGRPIQERIHRALVALKVSRRHLPQSLVGVAIDYALAQWPMLCLWLEDGRIEIDNNLVETRQPGLRFMFTV